MKMTVSFCGGCLVGWMALAGSGLGQTGQLVSQVDPNQTPAGGAGESGAPILSADGRFVVFASSAQNLALLRTGTPLQPAFPAPLQVYVRDRSKALTTLVTENSSGTGAGNGDSLPGGISADGRYVVFESSAGNLVTNDANNASDVFVRDLVSGTTRLVSVARVGAGPGHGSSHSPAMTPDGRYVAFVSSAPDLVSGDTNGIADVFVRDLQSGLTTLASEGAWGPTTGYAIIGPESPVLTPDGRYVAFFSTASGLAPGAGTKGEIYLRDLTANTTIWASSGAAGWAETALGSTNIVSFNHVLSADGQYVAYEAACALRGDPTGAGLVLRYSLASGATDLVHTNALVPNSPWDEIHNLDMTPDGRWVAFVANVAGDKGTNTCIRVWDAATGTSSIASEDLNGEVSTNSQCDWPALDADGRHVVFLSTAPNLVTNELQGEFHLYARDLPGNKTTLLDADGQNIGTGVGPGAVPCVSDDGQRVAFEAPDAALVSNDNNHGRDIFVVSMEGGASELISERAEALPSLSPNGHSAVSASGLSADGRFIAFTSEADNVAAGDSNGFADVFVRDTVLGTNYLVSAATNGFSGDGRSSEPSISADGRYVAFTSLADNLAANDGNGASDVFLRDLQSGSTTLVSVRSDGAAPGSAKSTSPVVSADGQRVVFYSLAQDLVAGRVISGGNIFVRDMQSNITYAVSTAGVRLFGSEPIFAVTPDARFICFAAGSPVWIYLWDFESGRVVYTNRNFYSEISFYPLRLSAQGNRIAYVQASSALATSDLHVLDWFTGTNRTIAGRVDVSRAGMKFSHDGRFLAYATRQSLAAADINNRRDVYCYDFDADTNTWISQSYSGTARGGASDVPDMSGDGRFIAFQSTADLLTPTDTNGLTDVFLYDRQERITLLLSGSLLGNHSANGLSYNAVFSPDGQTVAFQSWAQDLVPGDLNGNSDLFAVRIFSSSAIPVFAVSIGPDPQKPGGCQLTWPVVPERMYAVQFKDSLGEPEWHQSPGPVTVIGSQGSFKDSIPSSGQRFYRIVAY